MPTETRREKTVNNRGVGVTTITLEELGASTVDAITKPSGSDIRNVRRSIAEGRATLQYDIIDSSVGDSYSLTGTASQEPLATHPFFQASGKWAVPDSEWKIWDKWQKEGTDISAQALTSYGTGFQKFVSLYLKGFTDYLQPRLTLRLVDANTSAPTTTGLGKIATPAQAPSLPSGANWLLSGIDATRDADNNWEVSREYISSGPGGWNTDIYSAT
jgi:hypothetical protein